MTITVRCGLVFETNSGLKKTKIKEGGGTRPCVFDKRNLRFGEVHDRFRKIFELDHRDRTSMTDFQHRRINYNEYASFEDYMAKFCLTGRNIAIYLHVRNKDVDDNDMSRMTMMKKNTWAIKTPTSSASKEKSFSSVQSVNRQQIPQSSSEYSFEIANDELLKNVRDLVYQNSFDKIMFQLFGYLCEIRDYVFSTINPLKQQLKQSYDGYFQINNQSEIKLHSSNLKNVYDICRSAKTLLDQNKNKFGVSEIFPIITKPFSEFYHHLEILRNQWLERVENNDIVPNTSLSAGSRVPSTSNPHIQSLSQDHAHQTVPSSSIFKQLSSFRTSVNNETNKKLSLFQPLISCFKHFLNLLDSERLSSFHASVKSTIAEIQDLQSKINLFDKQSLRDAERIVLSIKDQINKKIYTQCFYRYEGELNRQLGESHEKILKTVQLLLTSLSRYQLQTDQKNRQEGSNWSSPPPPFIDQQQSNKRKSQTLDDDDDDQSSVATSSSVDEEILFNGVQSAFGYDPRRFH